MIKLPQLRGNCRLMVWCLLCVLTILIFLYPAQLHYQYAIIQSLSVFSNLPLFTALFYVWFALILVLMLFPGGNPGSRDWENVALVGIFVLVFSGIWVSLTQGYNGEFLSYAFQTMRIVETGSIPAINGMGDYPGLPLLLSSFRLITGLDTFGALVPLLVVNMLLYSTLLYILLRSLLKEPFLASFGSLILLMGSREVAILLPELHPRNFSLVLFVALLVLLFNGHKQTGESRAVSHVLLSIIIFGALTMTHLVTTMVFVIILIGMYLVGRFSRKNLVELSNIILFAVIVFSWQIYQAIIMTTSVVYVAAYSLRQLLGGAPLSDYFLHITGSYFGAEGTPIWANIVRFFWLALNSALGAIIGLKQLLKIRELSLSECKLVGGLVGLGTFVILTLVTSGLVEGIRALYYLPLLSVPLMLGFLSGLRYSVKRVSLVLLVVILLAVSVPSFLVHNDRVGVAAVYPQEIATSKFLSRNYGKGEALQVAGDSLQQRLISLDMPDTNYIGSDSFLQGFFGTQEEPAELPWIVLEILTYHFLEPGDLHIKDSLFILTPRLSTGFMFVMRTDVTKDPRWQELQDRLNQQALTYNNGFTEVYHAEITQ